MPEHQKQQATVTGLVTASFGGPDQLFDLAAGEVFPVTAGIDGARPLRISFRISSFCREFTLPGMPETRANPAMAVLTLNKIMISVESR